MSEEQSPDINTIQPLRFPWMAVVFFGSALIAIYLIFFQAATPVPTSPPSPVQTATPNQPQSSGSPLTASAGRITGFMDDGNNLTQVDPKGTPEIYFRVTLDNPPAGQKVALECIWIDPAGNEAHHNRYETKVIDKSPWQTHAKYLLPTNATPGRWTVRMTHEGREIFSSNFTLKDAEAPAPTPEK